jgi:serine/threonine protein kinase
VTLHSSIDIGAAEHLVSVTSSTSGTEVTCQCGRGTIRSSPSDVSESHRNVQSRTSRTCANVPGPGVLVSGKYVVESTLGAGGMGVVLAARHQELGHQVAIKVLVTDEENAEAAMERFMREGRAMASLQNDHVVRVHDVGRLETGIPFIVMELLRGQDLGSYVARSGPPAVGQAVDWILQAAGAVVEAHERGIVHRDLKPANLFLTQRSDGAYCIKVLDFGISKQLAGTGAPDTIASLTSTRQVVGSPAYMSPEQVRNSREVDHRTDIWAIGMTLYELLTGRTAFCADTFAATCAAIVADPPPPMRQFVEHVPAELESVVLRCLEKDPSQRYASVSALADALRPFASAPSTVKTIPAPRNAIDPECTPPAEQISSTMASEQSLGQVGAIGADSDRMPVAQPWSGTLQSASAQQAPLAGASVSRRKTSRALLWAFLATGGFAFGAISKYMWVHGKPGLASQNSSTTLATSAAPGTQLPGTVGVPADRVPRHDGLPDLAVTSARAQTPVGSSAARTAESGDMRRRSEKTPSRVPMPQNTSVPPGDHAEPSDIRSKR